MRLSVTASVFHRMTGQQIAVVGGQTPGPVVGHQDEIAQIVANAFKAAAISISQGALNPYFDVHNPYSCEMDFRISIHEIR